MAIAQKERALLADAYF